MKPQQSDPVIEERAIGASEQLPMTPFRLVSDYVPAGDQPQAIAELIAGVNAQERDQVLLGVTGSGKTFTIAHVIQAVQRPALVLAPNKTLAAQLYGEMKSFFPENAVEYFVSYYDYYQPEAYVPRTDTYIEKESSLNEQIDRMRHSATRALFERRDVIIVASVSCIYGIGAPETYSTMTITLKPGDSIDFSGLVRRLIELQYKRNETAFYRGTFRIKGDILELFPAHLEDRAWRLSLFGEEIESIVEFDPLTGQKVAELPEIKIYANSHYVTPKPTLQQAVKLIREELKIRLKQFEADGKLLEAQRLEQRVNFDMEMIEATGVCAGIENYSRYLTGRNPGEPPPTLFEYLPADALLIADESHVSIPQIGGMFKGDWHRKSTLSEYGFRLPSCTDNRPLILIGPPGSGKTVVAAKLAARCVMERRPVQVISTDVSRAAAGEQLAALCRVMSAPFIESGDARDLRQAVEAVPDTHKLVIDTAGINLHDAAERKALKALIQASGAEPVAVLAAGTDAMESGELAAQAVSLGARRYVGTRLDAARRLGALVAAADLGGLAFADVSASAFIGKGFERCDALTLAHRLLADPDARSSVDPESDMQYFAPKPAALKAAE